MTIVFSGGNNRSPNDTRILSVDINRVRNIQDEVKLSGRDLATIPEYVRRNIHLRILDLSNNSLGRAEDVVSELCDLKNLTRLNLSVNELKNIPLDFTSFPFLEVLCLAGNELEYLPEGITSLHRLKRLHCDFNHLGSLPLDWSSLVSLTSLTLSNNRLDQLPTTVWTLQCLEVLNLQRNRISVIGPLPEGAASRLKELRLSWNRLSGTLDLSPLVNISILDVSHNDLEDLEISKLYKLESLDVRQNALKALNLEGSRLRTLQADGNGLEIITCKQVPLYLEKLDISHNNFEYLPEWITEAKSLHTILADHNHLSHVPTEIFSCCNLMDLRLNHNFLVKLPDFLTQCHMKSLSLQYNKFEKLPYNFFWHCHGKLLFFTILMKNF
ncbi:protein phosphatase PHLPP-like protein [Trichonephila clavata]|uniref:Protein phosphatase PHLPP-like protein n=1 Tax=Trichonephila clavata TaxID=2740835 RepID=A0A8X6LCG2_TRICU|nr:protein phosphatase PHLPP-like protein [Trichonephila clavata]